MKKYFAPIDLLKDDDVKTYVEVYYEHLNIVLGYSGFLAGFQFLGMDFKAADDDYMLAASFLLVVGFVFSIFSVTLNLIYLGSLSAFRRENREQCLNPEYMRLFYKRLFWLKYVTAPMVMSVISTVLLLLSMNVAIHSSWPRYLSLIVNGITLIGIITIFTLNSVIGSGTCLKDN